MWTSPLLPFGATGICVRRDSMPLFIAASIGPKLEDAAGFITVSPSCAWMKPVVGEVHKEPKCPISPPA